jgi:sulfonate transport system substrate-binding protein
MKSLPLRTSWIRSLSLLASLATIVTATFSPVAQAQSTATPLPATIRFGEVGGTNVNSAGGTPLGIGTVAIADHFGFFKEEFGNNGPKIDEVFFAGTGPAQNEALAQGQIDFATYGGVPNVIGLASRVPAHIVLTRRASGAGQFYLGVHVGAPINDVADLRGKRITVQKGTNPYQVLLQLLASRGLQESDVKIVSLEGGDGLVAFNAGAVDAIFGGINLLILRDQQKLRVLDESIKFAPPDSQSGVLVANKFEKQYPDVTARVIKVLIKTSWWASQEQNREALLRFISGRSLSYKYVNEQYEGSLRDRFNPLIDASSYDAYRDIAKFAVDKKLIRKPVDDATIRTWFEPAYQQAALKLLHLEHFWLVDQAAAAHPPQ